jgi:hypothetical protein
MHREPSSTLGGGHVHTHKKSFISSLDPEEILDRFQQLSAEKRWTLTAEDQDSVHAQSGQTLKAGGENIEIRLEADPEGTHVHLVVSSRLGAWQLIDWGEASQFARLIVDRLREPGDTDH